MTSHAAYPGTQAVARAMRLLKMFGDDRAEWRLAELAQAAGLHKATAHRLLAALEREGMVARDPSGEGYRLGSEAIALAGRALRANDLRTAARPELVTLAQRSGETATLEVPAGPEMLILDEVVGTALVGASASIGTRWPAHATSTGKALLAARLPAARSEITDGTLARLTERTITSPTSLIRDLERAVQRGYATAVDELERGYAAVGAVVRDALGRPVGAISVGGPSSRLPAARLSGLGQEVRAAAARISADLGYRDR